MTDPRFTSEAELVQEFLRRLERDGGKRWTVYPETADWDLLLVHETGMQLGIEAKLSFNAKVIDQALDGAHAAWSRFDGPDFRAVLVPSEGRQLHLGNICRAIGIGVIALRPEEPGRGYHGLMLPAEYDHGSWVCWHPSVRCPVPDYVPDVAAGVAAPVKLTQWKIKAIKLLIILDRRGFVTRADMKALQISPTRWTDAYCGYLTRGDGGYVRCSATPDLRAQHPTNYAEIEADAAAWGTCLDPFKKSCPDWLLQEMVK